MKNIIKNIITRVLTVLMLVTVFTVPSVKPVEAAARGSSMSNPVVMYAGEVYSKKWTENSYRVYTRITTPARGYVKFTINKPLDGEDEYSWYAIRILNSSGTELITVDSYGQMNTAGKNAVFKIGLKAGTYYFDIINGAEYSTYRTSFTAKYTYSFTKTANFEVEPNNTKKKATALTLGQTMGGVYTDEYSESADGVGSVDYFKISLTKGISYRFYMSGFNAINATLWYGKILDPSGSQVLYLCNTLKSLVKDSYRYWDFTAPSTGTYYIYFYNMSDYRCLDYKIRITKSPANTWKKVDGDWYYFTSTNRMATGWQKVGTKWYYFDSYGAMYTNTWVYTGSKKSYVGKDGAMYTGWKKISGKWYYFGSDGYARKSWLKLSGKWYYFDSSCAMVTGWQQIYNDKAKTNWSWFYFNSSGEMLTGWQQIGGKWYYLGTEGRMVFGGGGYIGGKWYEFDDNGVCLNP